jgi:hypothetical protein
MIGTSVISRNRHRNGNTLRRRTGNRSPTGCQARRQSRWYLPLRIIGISPRSRRASVARWNPPARDVACVGDLCLSKISSGLAQAQQCGSFGGMIDLFKLLGGWLVGLFRSHVGREAEIMFLRHQLLILRRSAPPRLRLRTADRLIFVWLYRLFPSLLGAAIIFKPKTLVRWHRTASVSTGVGSRDTVSAGRRSRPRSVIWFAQSAAITRCGAHLHGEMLKLGGWRPWTVPLPLSDGRG